MRRRNYEVTVRLDGDQPTTYEVAAASSSKAIAKVVAHLNSHINYAFTVRARKVPS